MLLIYRGGCTYGIYNKLESNHFMLNGVSYFNFSVKKNHKAKVSSKKTVISNLSQKSDNQTESVRLSAKNNADKVSFGGKGLKFEILSGKNANELVKKYGKNMNACIKQVNDRAGKSEQFLNWIRVLPELQLERVDELHNIAKDFKGDSRGNLDCLGIGGSKGPIKYDLIFNNKLKNTKFFSGVEPYAVDAHFRSLRRNSRHMVTMRSGTTDETLYGFKMILKKEEELLTKDYRKQGKSILEAENLARKEAKERFLLVTLEGTKKKNDFRIWAEKDGYRTANIHEDCGGRYGYNEDPAAIARYFNGGTKSQLIQKCKGSLAAQEINLSTDDLLENPAALKAMSDVDAFINGKDKLHHYFYSDLYQGAPELNYQLHKESWGAELNDTHVAIGPDFFHHSTEADLDPGNTSSTFTLFTIKNNGGEEYAEYNRILDNFKNSYPEKHPASIVELAGRTSKDGSELAEFLHISTLLSEMLISKERKNPFPPINEPVRPVTQKHVEAYKAAVKKAREKFGFTKQNGMPY